MWISSQKLVSKNKKQARDVAHSVVEHCLASMHKEKKKQKRSEWREQNQNQADEKKITAKVNEKLTEVTNHQWD